jgi:hypothetical protein
MKLAFASLALVLGAATLSAGSLVVNGGFETGDFTGWTQGGNTGFMGVSDEFAYSGDYGAYFGAEGSDGSLSQTLTTVVGTSYTLSFWLENDGSGTNDFSVSWDGYTLLPNWTDADSFGYTEYTFSGLIGTGSDTLTFTARNDPGFYGLDDVSVSTGSAIPEPATLGLIGAALAGLGLLRKRSRA